MPAMVVGVFIGLLAPPLAAFMRPLLAPSVWFLLLISLLKIDARELVIDSNQLGRLSSLLFCFMIIMPMVMYGLLGLTQLSPRIVGGYGFSCGFLCSSLYSDVCSSDGARWRNSSVDSAGFNIAFAIDPANSSFSPPRAAA